MKCFHCNEELENDGTNLFCHKCGLILAIDWIKETWNAILHPEKVDK